MSYLNIEIKAVCHHPEFIRKYLQQNDAESRGTDHQVDTYFNVSRGRLKLREGNIENNLIYYERDDQPGAKESNFQLIYVADANGIKRILSRSLGIKIIVEKQREIYFIGNVKFHIDEVAGLGRFTEIEASNLYSNISKAALVEQCKYYQQVFNIREEDLISASYSDMLMALQK
jgi:predicted adenylyl cyclase CyaB